MTADRGLTPIRFGIWSARVDRVATEQAYARCSGSVMSCECVTCRNFKAVREHAFPAPVLALLADLGIDPRCEAEVYSLGRADSGLHRYGGWFHFIGELEVEIDNIERVGEHFLFWLTRQASLVPAAFGDSPVIQLEFVVAVPWILDEPQPE
jgi:hypothetical protein